jgi:acetyltransferase-like isoleucine patch superfamily enzyme
MIGGVGNLMRSWLDVLRVQFHVNVALLRHPTLQIQMPSSWRYDTLRALQLGRHVVVGPFTEIIAYSRTKRSQVPGKLVIGDHVFIGAGCNVRAAGGTISIGPNCMIGQNTAIVAANHTFKLGHRFQELDWDQSRTGVAIGRNCWIGAGCTLLPGVTIGDDCVIGSGSVVTKSIPAGEVWAGVPARFLKRVSDGT